MTVAVSLVRPYFTGWAYQNHYYVFSNSGLSHPVTLDDSTTTKTDFRNRFNGQFQGSANDPLTYAIDYNYNATDNTWDPHHGGFGFFPDGYNAYEVLHWKVILDKYKTALGYSLSIIDDRDIHNNASAFTNSDVLIFGHNEYFTQAEYDNLKTWISTSGGTAIFTCGNVFFCKVDYDSTTTPPKMANVDGHYARWHPGTKVLSDRILEFGDVAPPTYPNEYEHWTSNGRDENGSITAQAGERSSYWNFIFDADPGYGPTSDPEDPTITFTPSLTSFAQLYRSPYFVMRAHEDDFIVTPSDSNVNIIHDYGGVKSTVGANPTKTIACWYHNKDHGRILHLGTYWDQYVDTLHGSNRPIKAHYHWFMKRIAKPYFKAKPITP